MTSQKESEALEAVIRTARKEGRCVNARAHQAGNAPDCRVWIRKGDRYEQGDINPYEAGGFAHDRICAECSTAIKGGVHG